SLLFYTTRLTTFYKEFSYTIKYPTRLCTVFTQPKKIKQRLCFASGKAKFFLV
ncbi:hypothetical protein M5D96_014131, partial [Drosophila gunungcola]